MEQRKDPGARLLGPLAGVGPIRKRQPERPDVFGRRDAAVHGQARLPRVTREWLCEQHRPRRTQWVIGVVLGDATYGRLGTTTILAGRSRIGWLGHSPESLGCGASGAFVVRLVGAISTVTAYRWSIPSPESQDGHPRESQASMSRASSGALDDPAGLTWPAVEVGPGDLPCPPSHGRTLAL